MELTVKVNISNELYQKNVIKSTTDVESLCDCIIKCMKKANFLCYFYFDQIFGVHQFMTIKYAHINFTD